MSTRGRRDHYCPLPIQNAINLRARGCCTKSGLDSGLRLQLLCLPWGASARPSIRQSPVTVIAQLKLAKFPTDPLFSIGMIQREAKARYPVPIYVQTQECRSNTWSQAQAKQRYPEFSVSSPEYPVLYQNDFLPVIHFNKS